MKILIPTTLLETTLTYFEIQKKKEKYHLKKEKGFPHLFPHLGKKRMNWTEFPKKGQHHLSLLHPLTC